MEDQPLDFAGKPITPGCVIVYGKLAGNSGTLDEGCVCKTTYKESHWPRGKGHWVITIERPNLGYGVAWESNKNQKTVKISLQFTHKCFVTGESAESFWKRKGVE